MIPAANLILPQAGFQTAFLSSAADIVIGGSGAGVGKTWSLLAEPIRHCDVAGYNGVIFRRTIADIKKQGSLLDASKTFYNSLANRPTYNGSSYRYTFASGASIGLSGMQYEDDRFDWQGAELAYIGYDELTHFTATQFFYMLSRNRTTCGVRPSIRATCNPEPYGWVKKMIEWYLYPDDYEDETKQGFYIPERVGNLRYFLNNGEDGELIWGNSKEEVIGKAPHIFKDAKVLRSLMQSKINPRNLIKSFTFIPGSIFDNKKLLDKDPGYLGGLYSQSEHEKAKLLHGCWKMISGEDILYEYAALKDMFTNDFVPRGEAAKDRYITADIALQGADKFVVGVWDGWRLEKIYTMDKSDGKEVIDFIKTMAKRHGVPQSNIIYDSDGVGGFVGGEKGFIPGAKNFKGNAAPVAIADKNGQVIKEEYENLRTQCYYRLAHYINEYGVYIEDATFQDQIISELHATRKRKYDGRKYSILSKEEIKQKIKGSSPDFADMIMMRVYAELVKTSYSSYISAI